MKFKITNYKKLVQWVLVLVLSLFLVYTVIQIVFSLILLKREGVISRRSFHRFSLKPQVSDIQSWMTIRYINVIFSLPAEYLKSELDIQDKNYPNISISSLAKKNKVSTTNLLSETQVLVEKYLLENISTHE